MEDDGFGRRLREARERAGISQEELGAAAGVRLGSIYRYEAGRQEPKRGTIAAIARALDCDIRWLMTGELAAHVDVDEAPIPPNLARFLATPFGGTATPEQREALLAIRHYTGDASVAQWRSLFAQILSMQDDQPKVDDQRND